MSPRDRGAAVVDFVVVTVVLVPLTLGIMQLALVLYVRNVTSDAASQAARYAAAVGRSPGDGVAQVRRQLAGVLADRYTRDVDARRTVLGGAPGVEVTIDVRVPALGLGGPGVSFRVAGHAREEPR